MNNYEFNKNGVNQLLSALESENDDDTIEIILNGKTIIVPMCADNFNELSYALKSMLISEITGEATRGNLRVTAKLVDDEFNKL